MRRKKTAWLDNMATKSSMAAPECVYYMNVCTVPFAMLIHCNENIVFLKMFFVIFEK